MFLLLACQATLEHPYVPGNALEDTGATPEAEAVDCGIWPYHHVGATFVYEPAQEHHWEGRTVTVEDIERPSLDADPLIHVRVEKLYDAGSYAAETDTLYEVRCDDKGVWILGYDRWQELSWEDHDTTDTWDYRVDYHEPALWWPAELDVGTEWTSGGEFTTEDGSGREVDTNDHYTHRVTGTDTIETPAGTFDTLTIETTDGGSYVAPFDVAVGIGPVYRFNQDQLVDYTIPE